MHKACVIPLLKATRKKHNIDFSIYKMLYIDFSNLLNVDITGFKNIYYFR